VISEDDIFALCIEVDGCTGNGDDWGDELLLDTVGKGIDCVGDRCIVVEDSWMVSLSIELCTADIVGENDNDTD